MTTAPMHVYVLSPSQWEAFMEALDAPPRDLPKLRELFQRPSPFSEES